MIVLAGLALIVSALLGLALTVTLFGAPIGVPLLVLSIRSLMRLRHPTRRASAGLLLIGVGVLDLITGAFAGYQMVLANEDGLEARLTVASLFGCTAILLATAVWVQRSPPTNQPEDFSAGSFP